jgi:hypothetical protein
MVIEKGDPMTNIQAEKIKTIREQLAEMRETEWNKDWPTNRYIIFTEHLTDIVEELCSTYDDKCHCLICRLKRFMRRLFGVD